MQTSNNTRDEIIKNGGYYSNNNRWNGIITFPNDNRIYRYRVETLIFKNSKEIFVKKKTNGTYSLPGGSVEKDIPNVVQAENECREEARMKVSNILSTGLSYKEIKDNPHPWVSKQPIVWTGYYTEIYVADYAGKDTDPVEAVDRDPIIASGRFYTIKECYKFFSKEHREAIQFYLDRRKEMKESAKNNIIIESYITNYFKNKKFLKEISRHRELDTNIVNQILDIIDKSYLDLKSKSRIKREAKAPDGEYRFYPILSLDFPDKSSITIALNFVDKFSPGSAMHSDKYGDLVILQPNYFTSSRESKKMTLLHEIGHLRLSHLQEENLHRKYFFGLFGDVDIDNYRGNVARKGETMYPEINADLYAVLNGAKMYSILDTYNNDVANGLDYRVTNAELANRYLNVYKKYRGMLGNKVLENTSSVYELTNYDLYKLRIHNFVYENPNFEDISDIDKDILYKLIYEYSVTNTINKFKNYNEIITPEYIKESSEEELINFINNEKEARDKLLFNENHLIQSYDDINSTMESVNDFMYSKINEMITTYYEKKSDSITLEKNGKTGIKPPKVCDKCGGETGIFIKGEPVCLCKKCGKYFGTVEFKESDDSLLYGYITLLEGATKRKNLPDSAFGTSDRKFPLESKKHVYSAIKLFSHYHGNEKEQLAKKILSAMKKYNISMSVIGKDNPLRNYI